MISENLDKRIAHAIKHPIQLAPGELNAPSWAVELMNLSDEAARAVGQIVVAILRGTIQEVK